MIMAAEVRFRSRSLIGGKNLLQRTPSGRKYWSNAPKGDGTSPIRLGHFYLCLEDPCPLEGLSEDGDGKTSSVEQKENELDETNNVIVSSEVLETPAEQLGHLLIKQHEELEELRMRHKSEISDGFLPKHVKL